MRRGREYSGMEDGQGRRILPDRAGQIERVGAVGLVVNFLLAAFKAAVGFLSGSIAILLDAQAGARLDTTPWMYRPDREERKLNLPKGESELFTELYEQKVRK